MSNASSGSGKGEMIMMLFIITTGMLLAGGLASNYKPGTPVIPDATTMGGGVCCDSGDGNNCHPIVDATHPAITYTSTKFGSQQYGLLKSNVTLKEGGFHLDDTKQLAPVNNPIIVNTTQGFVARNGNFECGKGTQDQLWNPVQNGPQCIPIPDDEIVYVCKKNCFARQCHAVVKNVTCYGDKTTVYDAYFRLSDIPSPGIPDLIKNCHSALVGTLNTPNLPGFSPNVTTTVNPFPEHKTLQLSTLKFNVVNQQTGTSLWVSPYCKPAIYVYPPQTEQVHIAIAPAGKLLKTIPDYPPGGWTITADPNGTITYQNNIYDYLFYEARIPDALIPTQHSGYIVANDDLKNFFSSTLPVLGLNTKEQQQFSEYWLKALPKNPFYFISIVPQTILDTISPLTITPYPDTVLRITLKFQPLDQPIPVTPPNLPLIHRNGFTVVEWGGIFKQDKNHPFSCFM